MPQLEAGGFFDIIRIASSIPTMWQDIFYHNGYKMAHLLDEWIKEMEYVKEVLKTDDKEPMITYLEQAKVYRDGLDYSRKVLSLLSMIYILILKTNQVHWLLSY